MNWSRAVEIHRKTARVQPSKRQRGFGLGYVILTLALIGVTATVAKSMLDRGARAEYLIKTTSTMLAQQNKIREAITVCYVTYPDGNNGTAFNIRYPAGATAVAATTLICPKPNKSIWQGSTGGYLDPIPTGLSNWTYTNDVSGIKIVTTNSGAVPELTIVLDRVAAKLGSNQADRSGNDLTIWIAKP